MTCRQAEALAMVDHETAILGVLNADCLTMLEYKVKAPFT